MTFDVIMTLDSKSNWPFFRAAFCFTNCTEPHNRTTSLVVLLYGRHPTGARTASTVKSLMASPLWHWHRQHGDNSCGGRQQQCRRRQPAAARWQEEWWLPQDKAWWGGDGCRFCGWYTQQSNRSWGGGVVDAYDDGWYGGRDATTGWGRGDDTTTKQYTTIK